MLKLKTLMQKNLSMDKKEIAKLIKQIKLDYPDIESMEPEDIIEKTIISLTLRSYIK